MVEMEKIFALTKRRGFIYPSSEIYGGIAGFWDYGPLGVELKRNIKNEWWFNMVQMRDDVVGLDAAIIMNPKVWEASGHVKSFTDPLVECKKCHKRFRLDKFEDFVRTITINSINRTKILGIEIYQCTDGSLHNTANLTEPKIFNLLTEVYLGITEPKEKAYLRGEITQGVFVNFRNIVDSTRVKIPFGVAQIGKAFRNEITPGNFTFRSREFEQMELEFFVRPEEGESLKIFSYWKKERMKWYESLGIKRNNIRPRDHEPNERAHYARFATDIEYLAPFGWSELEGIHHRGNWDLSRHKISYRDSTSGDEYIPWIIETSGGVDRAALFFLIDAYEETDRRIILKLNPKLSPVKIAVFPLVANKSQLIESARRIFEMLKTKFACAWDERGNIGKRYLSQDETGTPWCVTVDYNTLKNQTVTVRDRDTAKQVRVLNNKLVDYFNKLLIG